MSAETKAIARRLLEEAFNGGNLDVVDELVSPEFVNYDAALPEPTRGAEAAKASIAAYRSQTQIARLVESIRQAGPTEYVRELNFRFYSPNNYKPMFA